MLSLDVKISGAKELKAALGGYSRQLPYALKEALNDTAFDVMKAERDNMKSVFDKPKPWTVKSALVERADKKNLEAKVFINPKAESVLHHQVKGGPRVPRAVTRKLRSMGALGGGEYTVYAPGYVRPNGNITLKRWKAILSAVSSPGGKYFVATIGGTKAIWIKKGKKKIAPVVFIKGKAPRYRPLFKFYKIAEAKVDRVWARNFDKALDKALRTAR